MLEIAIENADISEVQCDVLIMKYAQAFPGADAVVANALGRTGTKKNRINPTPHEHIFIKSRGAVASSVLFVGVVPLSHFDYPEIRIFVSRALKLIF